APPGARGPSRSRTRSGPCGPSLWRMPFDARLTILDPPARKRVGARGSARPGRVPGVPVRRPVLQLGDRRLGVPLRRGRSPQAAAGDGRAAVAVRAGAIPGRGPAAGEVSGLCAAAGDDRRIGEPDRGGGLPDAAEPAAAWLRGELAGGLVRRSRRGAGGCPVAGVTRSGWDDTVTR